MQKNARFSLFLLVVLSILALPLALQAGEEAETKQASVSAMRGEHAIISFGADGPVAIELRGKLVDGETDRPLPRTAIEVVRFEMDDEGQLATVTIDEVAAAAKEVLAEKTEGHGGFVLTNLAPGRYSLQVAWDEVPSDSEFVRFDLRWVERPVAPGSGR